MPSLVLARTIIWLLPPNIYFTTLKKKHMNETQVLPFRRKLCSMKRFTFFSYSSLVMSSLITVNLFEKFIFLFFNFSSWKAANTVNPILSSCLANIYPGPQSLFAITTAVPFELSLASLTFFWRKIQIIRIRPMHETNKNQLTEYKVDSMEANHRSTAIRIKRIITSTIFDNEVLNKNCIQWM